MTRLLSLALALATALVLAACGGGNSHDAVAKESVDTLTEVGDTLEKVTDKASAEKQVGKLEKLMTKMGDLEKRKNEVGEPSAEDLEAMKKKYEAKMTAAMEKVMKEMMRLSSNAEVMAIIGPPMEKMGG